MPLGKSDRGVIAAIFVSAREQKEEVADQQAEAVDTSNVATQVASQAPLAVLGGLLMLPGGATTAFKVAQLLGRNYPLVLLVALIGVLFWPTHRDDEETPISGVQAQRLGRSFAQSIPALDRQRRGNQSPSSENDGSCERSRSNELCCCWRFNTHSAPIANANPPAMARLVYGRSSMALTTSDVSVLTRSETSSMMPSVCAACSPDELR